MNCNCSEVAEKGKEKVENSLAMQLLIETAKQSKRWFVIAIIELAIILGIIAGVIYYLKTSNISCNTITQDSDGFNNYIGNDGGINSEPKN
uniref:Uncharacterized protein n=1 Tax=Siphoviridae sp. ctsxw88 TaxID=2825701 RepID=A0A8S5PI52_9CAUD|nr:MAG TPA: hypothetical protein [Siphoviridae sp. ctsxw88]